MPNVFSRIAGLSPRNSAARKKLFAIVSATVSTAGRAMRVSSLSLSPPLPALPAIYVRGWQTYLTPSFLLFPAPLAAGTCFLGTKVEFLDVLGMHQAVAAVVHDDTADLQHIAVMRGLQRHLGILLDQQDRHALLLVDSADDGENLFHQDRREAER